MRTRRTTRYTRRGGLYQILPVRIDVNHCDANKHFSAVKASFTRKNIETLEAVARNVINDLPAPTLLQGTSTYTITIHAVNTTM